MKKLWRFEQDFEETFWRVAEHSKNLDNDLQTWSKQMNMEIWYGDSGGPRYNELIFERPNTFKPNVKVIDNQFVTIQGEKYDAIGVFIEVGGSKGVYLIPAGCDHELA